MRTIIQIRKGESVREQEAAAFFSRTTDTEELIMAKKQNGDIQGDGGGKGALEAAAPSQQKSYMGAYTRFLFYTRLWTGRAEGDRLTLLFYLVVPAYAFFFVISLLEMSHNWGDLGSMTETLDMTLIFAVTGHKSVNLMWGERRWKRLVRLVESNFNRPQQRLNAQHRAIMDDSVRSGRVLSLVWNVLVSATLISLTLMPLGQSLFLRHLAASASAPARAADTNDTDNQVQPHTVPYLWSIPYRTWTPFDNWTGVPYVFVYVLHLFIASLQIFVVSGFDMFLIALLNYTCGQFRILQKSLLNVRSDAKAHVEETKGPEKMQLSFILLPGALSPEADTEVSPALDEEMQRRVRDYVDHHETLLKFVQDIEDMVNKVLLNQFFCSSVIICTSAFQLTVGNTGTVKLISMGELLISALFEMGMFCYYSNLLIDESTLVGYATYCCEWFHSSLRFRRSASLIMSRARRASYITFGRFTALSMETYAGILRISYTYFTVLSGMNE